MEMCKTLLGFAHFHRHRRHEPKQQNRTLHLLQKPDIFICYRQTDKLTLRPPYPLPLGEGRVRVQVSANLVTLTRRVSLRLSRRPLPEGEGTPPSFTFVIFS